MPLIVSYWIGFCLALLSALQIPAWAASASTEPSLAQQLKDEVQRLMIPITIDDHSKIFEVWSEGEVVFLVIQIHTEDIDRAALVNSHVRGFCSMVNFRRYMKQGAIYSSSYFDAYGRQFTSVATDERLCRQFDN